MNKCDLHVHTKFSCDSEDSLEDYCIYAIENNIKTICFTDHVDHNKNDYGYKYYNHENFFKEFYKIKNRFTNELEILSGIEFSEPHIYRKQLEEYSKLPYDFIIGSLHYWYKDMFLSVMIKENIPIEISYNYYWQELLKAVSYGHFDSIGHFDFPKRYYKKCLYDDNIIRQIFYQMIKNNISLEINTGSLRKGIDSTMPSDGLLALYKECGGQYITIGSDAHKPEELCYRYDYAVNLVQAFDFNIVIYRNRKREKYL